MSRLPALRDLPSCLIFIVSVLGSLQLGQKLFTMLLFHGRPERELFVGPRSNRLWEPPSVSTSHISSSAFLRVLQGTALERPSQNVPKP